MYDKLDALDKAIDGLAASRGMLLPRLISGKLPVDHLDIRFPPGMQEPARES
jgi:type I restriction enzyme S subunit